MEQKLKYIFTGLLILASLSAVSFLIIKSGKNQWLAQISTPPTTYYVDNAGNDSNTGTSPDQAWQTINHVNISSFNPGDQILFKRGGIWREQLSVPSSGTSGNNITFGAYGTGNKPIVDGADLVTGWTQYSGNIYVASIDSSKITPTQLYVDGVFYDIAHYPNLSNLGAGYLLATQNPCPDPLNPTSTQENFLIDSTLPSLMGTTSPSDKIVGSTIAMRVAPWKIENVTATNYDNTTGTITLSGSDSCMATSDGFYLQNKLWMLDSPNEWYYDSTASKIYLWTANGDNPTSHAVEISNSNHQYGISDSGKNYITIQDLAFKNAANYSVRVDSASNIIVQNLDIIGGLNGISLSNSSNISVKNNSIQNVLTDGIDANTDKVNNIDISNNTINNAGNVGIPKESYAGIYVGNYEAVPNNMDSINIESNTITNSGYIGLRFSGNNITVQKNKIDESCLVLEDCGGIYTSAYQALDNIPANPPIDAQYPSNNTIEDNVVTNSIGNTNGDGGGDYTETNAIYLDAVTYNTKVLDNIVVNADEGIFSNDGHDNTFTGNKVYSARRDAFVIRAGSMSTDKPGYKIYDIAKNNDVENNIFDSIGSDDIFLENALSTDTSFFSNLNNNEYCHSKTQAIVITDLENSPQNPDGTWPDLSWDYYTLSDWQTFSSQDANSTDTSSSCYSDAVLNNLTISSGTLSPAFVSSTNSYSASVDNSITGIAVTPTANQGNAATITINSNSVASGSPSASIPLSVGSNNISVVITAPDNKTISTYTIAITRAATPPSGGGGGGGGGGATPAITQQPQQKTTIDSQSSQILHYIAQILKEISPLVSKNSPLFAQPQTQPPSNLQPNQPPPTQTPTATTNNNAIKIQVLQKILMLIKSLLAMMSKQ